MEKITQLSPALKNWILATLHAGAKPVSIFDAMLRKGFDERFAFSTLLQLASHNETAAALDVEENIYTYEDIAINTVIETGGRKIKVLSKIEKPFIVHFDDFLTHEECDELIKLAEYRLESSKIIDFKTGEIKASSGRTSSGMSFVLAENDLVERIENRISEVTSFPRENGEGLQVLHYGIGEEYKLHYDYFPPGKVDLTKGGQRAATFLLYLNDVDEGGETVFPKAGVSIVPKKGAAVYFHYRNSKGELDPLSLHSSVPVKTGEKWVATKWIRQGRIYS